VAKEERYAISFEDMNTLLQKTGRRAALKIVAGFSMGICKRVSVARDMRHTVLPMVLSFYGAY
jgi:hypothetical protein